MIYRTNTYLEKYEYQKIYNAVINSKENKTPLNLFLTLNLEELFTKETWRKEFQKLLNKLRNFYRRKGQALAYVWVAENTKVHGTHVHMLLYQPNCLTLKALKKFLRKTLKLKPQAAEINLKELNQSHSWETNIQRLIDYICKGIRYIHKHLLTRDQIHQGKIVGKRYGISHNILINENT